MKKILLLVVIVLTTGFTFAQKANRSKIARESNDMVVSGVTSSDNIYKELLQRRSMLEQELGTLSGVLGQTRGGKARKISDQIERLTADIAVTERLLATFPKSTSGESIEAIDDKFERELDSVAAIRIAVTDPFAGRISSDPELERMYRDYLAQNGTTPFLSSGQNNSSTGVRYSDGERVFRIMIAISKTPLSKSSFNGMSDVMEQQMPSGGMVYYQGTYSTLSDAQRVCNSILSQRRFRDAFVVAMVGNRRVPLN